MLEIGLEQDQTAWAWGTRKQEKDLWPHWAVRYGTRVDDAETPGWVGGGAGLRALPAFLLLKSLSKSLP